MAKLKLTAENAGQERVLKYLEENASDVLAEKINGGNKTMAGCWTYIVSRARSLAKNSCACVEDAEVYGWAVHYFEEDDLNSENGANKGGGTVDPKVHEAYTKRLEEQNKALEEKQKREKEEKARKEQEKMEELRKRNEEREERVRKKLEEEQRKKAGGIEGQLSLFDLLGGE